MPSRLGRELPNKCLKFQISWQKTRLQDIITPSTCLIIRTVTMTCSQIGCFYDEYTKSSRLSFRSPCPIEGAINEPKQNRRVDGWSQLLEEDVYYCIDNIQNHLKYHSAQDKLHTTSIPRLHGYLRQQQGPLSRIRLNDQAYIPAPIHSAVSWSKVSTTS